MSSGRPSGFVRALLLLLSGPLIWFAHFSLIYGAQGFGGAFGFTTGGIRAFAWAATFIAGAAIAAIYVRVQRQRPSSDPETVRSLARTTRWLAVLSLGAVLLQALVLAVIPR
ncbi:MAG: hypothetical protein WD044_00450 [Dongiaceae bacterium]